MSESLKPMRGYLMKFAELYEQGRSLDEMPPPGSISLRVSPPPGVRGVGVGCRLPRVRVLTSYSVGPVELHLCADGLGGELDNSL